MNCHTEQLEGNYAECQGGGTCSISFCTPQWCGSTGDGDGVDLENLPNQLLWWAVTHPWGAVTNTGVGDFDGDSEDDVVTGNLSEYDMAGSVTVEYYSTSLGEVEYRRGVNGVNGTSDELDYFGASIAIGDFDNDGYDDLAIGVPGDEVSSESAAGSLHVLYGSSSGLSASGDQIWHQDSVGILGEADAGDYFGWIMTVGDMDDDGYDDLIVGSPNEKVSRADNAGYVAILYGSTSGLTAVSDDYWSQDSSGIYDTSETDDAFGFQVVVVDWDGDGYDDLLASAPGEDLAVGASSYTDFGLVHILYGSSSGVVATGNDYLTAEDAGVDPDDDLGFGTELKPMDVDEDGVVETVAISSNGDQEANSYCGTYLSLTDEFMTEFLVGHGTAVCGPPV